MYFNLELSKFISCLYYDYEVIIYIEIAIYRTYKVKTMSIT